MKRCERSFMLLRGNAIADKHFVKQFPIRHYGSVKWFCGALQRLDNDTSSPLLLARVKKEHCIAMVGWVSRPDNAEERLELGMMVKLSAPNL